MSEPLTQQQFADDWAALASLSGHQRQHLARLMQGFRQVCDERDELRRVAEELMEALQRVRWERPDEFDYGFKRCIDCVVEPGEDHHRTCRVNAALASAAKLGVGVKR